MNNSKKKYIAKGNCYLKIRPADAKLPLSANLRIIRRVYNDDTYTGFAHDTYDIDENGIYYEDACWTGVSIEERENEKRIHRNEYERWVRRIRRIKKRIYELACANSHPFQRPLKVGDIICIELDNHDLYYNLNCCKQYDCTEILKIVSIKDEEHITAIMLDLNRYFFRVDTEPRDHKMPDEDIIKSMFLIDSNTFDRLVSLFHKTTSDLLKQMIDVYK